MSLQGKTTRGVAYLNDVVAGIAFPSVSRRIPMAKAGCIEVERNLSRLAWVECEPLKAAKFVYWARDR